MKQIEQADWLSLVLHYAFGAIAALGLACIGHRGFRAAVIDHMHEPGARLIVIGLALAGGGLGGLLQDKLWNRDSYRMIPPDEPRHSLLSTALLISSIGFGLVILGIGLYFYCWR